MDAAREPIGEQPDNVISFIDERALREHAALEDLVTLETAWFVARGIHPEIAKDMTLTGCDAEPVLFQLKVCNLAVVGRTYRQRLRDQGASQAGARRLWYEALNNDPDGITDLLEESMEGQTPN